MEIGVKNKTDKCVQIQPEGQRPVWLDHSIAHSTDLYKIKKIAPINWSNMTCDNKSTVSSCLIGAKNNCH